MFYDVTNTSNKLSACFNGSDNFSQKSNNFIKTLNRSFHQCFKKIRVTNKTNGKSEVDEVQKYLDLKSKLQIFLSSAKSYLSKQIAENKIKKLEELILECTATKMFKQSRTKLMKFKL